MLPGPGTDGMVRGGPDRIRTDLPARPQGQPGSGIAPNAQERLHDHQGVRGPDRTRPAAFGAHSLRAGFLTSAARRGASVFKMRDVSRHKSMDVLQSYVRDADLFRDHAGAGLL